MRKSVAPVPTVQFVAFRVGPAEFAVDIFAVQEILRRQPVVRVPQTPEFVDGVIELRGELVPVVDLRRRFGIDDPVDDGSTRVMVARLDGERIGLVVDTVTEVLRVPEGSLSDPPAYVRDVAADYLRSIVKLPERLLVVLDLQRVLSSDELVALRDLEPLLRKAKEEMTRSDADAADPTSPEERES